MLCPPAYRRLVPVGDIDRATLQRKSRPEAALNSTHNFYIKPSSLLALISGDKP